MLYQRYQNEMISIEHVKQIIEKYIQEIQSLNVSSREKSIKYCINTKISKILEILVGTCRSTRLGPKPLTETLEIIGENIKLNIQNRLPINATICFGCKKTWKLCQPGVDIAELFTFLQLWKLNKEIQNIYPPGINFSLYIGDAWYEYIYHENFGNREYYEGLQKLLNLNNDIHVKLISMHDFHRNNSNLYKTCNENLELLREYWNESSNVDEKNRQYLKSYQKLKSVGWLGLIPNIMRMHYLKKMNRYLPNTSVNKRVDAVLRFFSYGLMLNQNDLIKRQNPADCTLDISLLSPPPGMPKRLRGNRLYMRSLPPEISSRGAPCWTVMGILKMDEHGSISPSTLSPRDYNDREYQFIERLEYSYGKYSTVTLPIALYKIVN